MPGGYPYGVRAMWSERSRHMRGGAVLGPREKVAGLALRFLTRDMRLTGAKAAGVTCQDTHCRATQSIFYLGASQGQPRVPVANGPDTFGHV